MRLLNRLRSWLRAMLRRSRVENEMDAELRFHIEAFAEDLVRNGVPREEALRRARSYLTISKDLGRVMSRVKAIYRSGPNA